MSNTADKKGAKEDGTGQFLEKVESLKCMAVGDPAVGKTCLLISYSSNEFPKEYNPTVFDNYTANCVFKGRTVALGLWDTAGAEEYDQLRPISYPDTHVFIICYSVNQPETLSSVENKWVKEIKEHAPDVPFILVGNKSDLRNDEKFKDKCIPIDKAKKMADKIKAERWLECSAKTQDRLKEVFDTCIQVVYDDYLKKVKKASKDAGGKGDKKDCILQ
jgi:Ras-related C3 botulinum toxin substrate 1